MKSVTVVGTWTARDNLEICAERIDGSVRNARAEWRSPTLPGMIFGASGQTSAPFFIGEKPDVRGCCWGRADAVNAAVRARKRENILTFRRRIDSWRKGKYLY